MSIWSKIAEHFKHSHSEYDEFTVQTGEYLENPDIYIKYIDDGARLLFTNKEGEWSEFTALLPEERRKYVSDLSKMALHIASLDVEMQKIESRAVSQQTPKSKKSKSTSQLS